MCFLCTAATQAKYIWVYHIILFESNERSIFLHESKDAFFGLIFIMLCARCLKHPYKYNRLVLQKIPDRPIADEKVLERISE